MSECGMMLDELEERSVTTNGFIDFCVMGVILSALEWWTLRRTGECEIE